MPTKQQKILKPLSQMVSPVHRGQDTRFSARGTRFSARQRQKREKQMASDLKRQTEKIHAGE